MNKEYNPSGWNDINSLSHADFDHMPAPFPGESFPDEKVDMVLAMSYVKRQKWGEVLDCEAGLSNGTIFPELVKPFLGQGGIFGE